MPEPLGQARWPLTLINRARGNWCLNLLGTHCWPLILSNESAAVAWAPVTIKTPMARMESERTTGLIRMFPPFQRLHLRSLYGMSSILKVADKLWLLLFFFRRAVRFLWKGREASTNVFFKFGDFGPSCLPHMDAVSD